MASDPPEPHPRDVRIGATIQELRKAHELTQTELARAIGVSRQLLTFIEAGQRRASMTVCRSIAGVLGVKLAAITIENYDEITDTPAPVPDRRAS